MHRTNIELDETLVKEAMKLTRITTKKELINFALAELVRRKRRKKILNLKGKVDWIGELDDMRADRL
ncbi:MAG TPA: type II toxin-antitoxin system VapB family antitoxin [Planktothrix sp.]